MEKNLKKTVLCVACALAAGLANAQSASSSSAAAAAAAAAPSSAPSSAAAPSSAPSAAAAPSSAPSSTAASSSAAAPAATPTPVVTPTPVAAVVPAAPAAPAASDLGNTDVTQNKAYVGLVWTLGASSFMPDAVVGLRHAKTTASSDVSGYDVSARFKLGGKFAFDSVRAVYLDGKRSSQLNVGLGYSATHQSAFGTFGAGSEYLKLGLDYLFKPAKFIPFVEINSLEKPAEVKPVEVPAQSPV